MKNAIKNVFYITCGYLWNTRKDWITAIIVGLMLAWFAAQGF